MDWNDCSYSYHNRDYILIIVHLGLLNMYVHIQEVGLYDFLILNHTLITSAPSFIDVIGLVRVSLVFM